VAIATSRAPVTSLYRLNQNSDEALDAPWRPFAATWFYSRPGTKDQMSWGNHGRDAGLRCSVRQAINRPVEAKGAHANTPYKDGSIYSQLVVGCYDNLNRALLKEFRKMGN